MFFSEIAASLYPWDIADEGVERILDNLEEMTGCNSTYLIAVMHHEKRPLTDYFYPHNPVRKTYCPEDSRAYFRPDKRFYGRIAPLTSDRDFLKATDWLQALIDAARKRSMKTGAELSHTLIDRQRARTEFADCMQCDIFGARSETRICPNNPDAREYVIALFCDLATNYDLDYIQTCLMPFDGGRRFTHSAARLLGATLGGCFCEFCERTASEHGIDLPRIRAALRAVADSVAHPTLEQSHEMSLLLASNTSAAEILMELPDLLQWLIFRRDSLAAFYRDIHSRIHDIRPAIDLRLNAYITSDQELEGLSLRALKPHLDSIRSSDYSEQSGDMSSLEHKRRWLMSVRRAVGEDMPLLSGIGVRPRATPETVREGVVISAQCGADGITLGHYDGAPFALLRAVREGMELAGVEVKPRRPALPPEGSAGGGAA
jgi:hypothetical protein